MIRLGIALLAAGLAGCADMPAAPVLDEEATVKAGYGRAFGRIRFIDHGREAAFGQASTRLWLFARAPSEERVRYLEVVEEDGSFSWPLQAGEYLLVGFKYQHAASGRANTLIGRLMTTFSIPRPGEAAYLGDVEVRAAGGRYEFRVLDRENEAVRRAGERIANFRPVKALMQLETRPGSYSRVVSICNTTIWQVDCLGGYQGVEPLQPPETEDGFPLVETLRPLLEWKPAGRPEVTYDVAIYESLTLSYATLDKEMLHGPLVGYAEGLKEPRYVPPMPLEPGKRYVWSVRLRDRDIVSTWSTSRRQGLLGVVRQSGRTFGFTTPSRLWP